MRALLAISAWFLAVLYLGLENLYDLSKAELAEKKRYNHSFHTFFYEYILTCKGWVATVFWVARTHLARLDLGAHAHVCARPI